MKAIPLLLLLAMPALAQKGPTPNTFSLAPGAERPKATIADMAWMEGHWTGEALGGTSEEIWSPPRAGGMMGMYRLIKDGKVVFYEILTFVEEEGSLSLKLKHFNADLTGWEEKAEVRTFKLVKLAPNQAHFEGMSFHRLDKDNVLVYLAIDQKDGTAREAEFRYRRAGS